ncbi:alpha/beta hydrolase fold domain-containing protein [Nocardioides humi]|uniref:Alpha/beta hydrolase n=1 Tax=Nocardioides humi TaxID=449461 RepID=A0ABN2ADF9_9ACTN|nr:alpha/beta hydrolase fold domain-containing protein [Nocardioides humi]
MADLRAKVVALNDRFYDPPEHSFDEVDAGGVPSAWVRSPDAGEGRVVLYFHGGGYGTGSIHTHRDLAARISRAARAAVLSVDYRLAPEHRFPAAVDDGLAAYDWLLDVEGYVGAQVSFSGDSAGAGLALGLGLACRDLGRPLPSSIAVISPLGDLAHSGASVQERAARDPLVSVKGSHAYATRYVRSWHDLRNPYASPVFGDFAGMPPVLLLVGTEEALHDDSTRIAATIERNGGEVDLSVWEGMVHDWPLFSSQVSEGQQAVDELGAFVDKRFG